MAVCASGKGLDSLYPIDSISVRRVSRALLQFFGVSKDASPEFACVKTLGNAKNGHLKGRLVLTLTIQIRT